MAYGTARQLVSRHRRISRAGLVGTSAMALSLILAACGSSSGTASSTSTSAPSTAKSQHYTIGWIQPAPVTALIDMGKGIKIEAERLGMTVVTASSNFTSSEQLAAMNSMITRHVNAIITAPNNPKAFEGAVQKAKQAGIPVFTYSGSVPGVTADIVNPDYQAAYNSVKIVAKHLKAEGKPCDIALLLGLRVVSALDHRDEGLTAGAKAAGCTVLATQTEQQTTPTAAAAIASQWKTQFGTKLQAILPFNDSASLGVVSTFTSKFHPLTIGFNGSPQDVKDVASGTLYMDFGLENVVMGMGFALAAHEVLTGHSVPKTITSPYVTITQANASSYKGDANYLLSPPKNVSIASGHGTKGILKFSHS